MPTSRFSTTIPDLAGTGSTQPLIADAELVGAGPVIDDQLLVGAGVVVDDDDDGLVGASVVHEDELAGC